jgi:Glyoxalase-like domain
MIDHLVYATNDLGPTVAEIAERLGVEPVAGGAHIGRGTRNYLVGLGHGAYLEIIGPDDEQPEPLAGRPFDLDRLDRARLVTWCARPVGSLDEVVAHAASLGNDLGPVAGMARSRPDGTMLSWRLTPARLERPWSGTLPFLIDWGDSPHPSSALAQGVSLVQLRLEHPEPERVHELLAMIGEVQSVEIVEARAPRLSALLQTPDGVLTFS